MFRTSFSKSVGAGAAVLALGALTACGGQSTATPQPAAAATSPTASPSPPTPTVGADGGPIQPLAGSGSLGAGFVTPSAPPPPGGTMTPSAGSWSGAHTPAGYRVALLSTDEDAQTKTLATVVRAWAKKNGVTLTLVPAHKPANYLAAIQKAIDFKTDLVVSVGQGLADPLAVVTASWEVSTSCYSAPSWPSRRTTSPRRSGRTAATAAAPARRRRRTTRSCSHPPGSTAR